ncbi:hypothetical protein PsYK624_144170 [Phanerochaete sordida]|uniref:F-box domain-containing protein n=1 Tax=Phanerochaete sordida TaxID=48140 RepID=A0A9P3GRQ8_9APHY|nr:hypothetical protein PsYK624_144170 [Phanerochaete sordida]
MSEKSFPVLKYLHLPTLGGVRGMQPSQITVPNLTQLRVNYHCAGAILDSAPLHLFSKLTTLELNVFRYKQQSQRDRFVSILHSASATLEVLILRRGQFDPTSGSGSASLELMPTIFPRLTFLVLDAIVEYCDSAHSIVGELCRAAHVLERLHIVRYFPSRVHAYLHSGSLCFPTVRFLRYFVPDQADWDKFIPGHTDWHNFIYAFPCLEELQISGGDPTPMIHAAVAMDVAAKGGNGSPAWPRLANLALFGAHEAIAIRFVQHRAAAGHPLSVVAYEGWLLIRTERIFADLNVTFVPLNRWPANGDDYDEDWVEYWHIINGTLPFRRRPAVTS